MSTIHPASRFKSLTRQRAFLLANACAALVYQTNAGAAISIDGSYDADYGTALGLQTNNSGFGANNELDGLYAKVSGGNLNILITGNLSTDFTHINLYIADGRPGQSTINANGALAHTNGSKFSPGFSATYALDMNGNATSFFVNQYTMPNGGTAQSASIGSIPYNDHTAHTLLHGAAGLNFSFDNTNTAGISGSAPSAADQVAAGAVQSGLEISIPLSELGSPSNSQIGILAAINGSNGNDFLSNQFLPGLPTVQGNIGNNGVFDFSGVPNMFALVTAPSTGATNGVWALAGGGSWGASASWSGGIPQLVGDTALFGANATGAATVTLDGSKSVARITFNNATNSYTIVQGSGGTLSINDSTSPLPNPAINVNAGNHTIAAPVQLAGGVTVDTDNGTRLTISSAIGGTGGILKNGEGTLVLSGSNSFSGNIQSTSGVLEFGASAAASGAVVSLGDPDVDNQPATLLLGASVATFSNVITTNRDLAANNNLRTVASAAVGTTTLSGAINVNGGVVFAPALGGTMNVTGVIQDGTFIGDSTRHAIRIAGGGTTVLSNVETASGDTFVDSGTLILTSSASLASGSFNVFTGGVANINGSLIPTVKIYSQGTTNFPGNIAGASPTLAAGTIEVDSGGLVKVGTSTSSAAPRVVTVGQVDFFGDFTGKIDLTNNQLITTNTQTTVRDQLHAGNFITTASPGTATLGYKDTGGGTTQIQFAVRGDASLDGQTNMQDFNVLALNFNSADKFWQDGDFNYDGVVNALDFNEIASSFGHTLPAPLPAALGSLVPEPASMTLIGLALASLLRRKRA